VEQDKSKTEIVLEGFEESVVKRVIRLIDISEYKRRQAPLGVKITSRGFGKDRRYPITNRYSQ
jgi:NAD+ synthase (glutamine-hydrolysing)